MSIYQPVSKFMTKSEGYSVHKEVQYQKVLTTLHFLTSLERYKWHYPDPFWVWKKAKVVLSSDGNV